MATATAAGSTIHINSCALFAAWSGTQSLSSSNWRENMISLSFQLMTVVWRGGGEILGGSSQVWNRARERERERDVPAFSAKVPAYSQTLCFWVVRKIKLMQKWHDGGGEERRLWEVCWCNEKKWGRHICVDDEEQGGVLRYWFINFWTFDLL